MYSPTIYTTETDLLGSSQQLYEWNGMNSPKGLLSRNNMIKKSINDSKSKRPAQDGSQERKIMKFGDRSNENSIKFNIRTIETPNTRISNRITKLLEDSKRGLSSKVEKTGNYDPTNDSLKPANTDQEPLSAGLEEYRKREFRKNLVIDTEPQSATTANSKLRSSSTRNIKISRNKYAATPSNLLQDSQIQERNLISSNRNSSPVDSFAKDTKTALFQIKKKNSLRDDSDWSGPPANRKSSNILNKFLSQVPDKGESSAEKKGTFTPTNATSNASSNSVSQGKNLKVNNFTQGVSQQASLTRKHLTKNQKERNGAFFDDESEDELTAAETNPSVVTQTSLDLKKAFQQYQKANPGGIERSIKIQKQYSGVENNDSARQKNFENTSLTRSATFQSKGAFDLKQSSPSQQQDNSNSALNGFITRVSQGDAAVGIAQKQSNQQEQPTEPLSKSALMQRDPNSQITKASSSKVIKTESSGQNRGGLIATNKAHRYVKGNAAGTVSSSQEIKPSAKATFVRQTSLLARPFVYYITNLTKYLKNPSQNDLWATLYREHFLQTYQSLTFCKSLRPVDPFTLSTKMVYLERKPSAKGKKTLIFDLDETLIHCNESTQIPFDVKLPIIFPNGDIIEAGVNIRPYAMEILKELSTIFEIIVFTASHSCYANVVLDYLDPKGVYIHHRLFRESCVQTPQGVYIKDLRIFGDRELSDLILVDNAAYSFGNQLENGVPIIPYYNNKEDQELKNLVPFLKTLAEAEDLREVIRQTFKFHLYTQYDSSDMVLEKVVLSK